MDKQKFLAIDRQVFDRLSSGSLGPVTLALTNGATIAGETKGVARGQSEREGAAAGYWGRILLATDSGDVEIDYASIAGIS
jgi:hypothetical protein